jgi:cyclase
MYRSLIVAKINPGAEGEVARIFAQSDQTDLPVTVGVRRRQLYSLGDLYIHLLETTEPGARALGTARHHEEFDRISARLRPFISPYLPTWRSPADAVATCFYSWENSPADHAAGPSEARHDH